MNNSIFKFYALLLFLSFLSLNSFAQLPDGSIATDFTAIDINGNSHTLSDYLNDGIPVLLDFSSAMNSYSFGIIQDGAFESIWNEFGFSATGDSSIMIFLIETDPASGIAELMGNNGAPGDWTSEISFPIIDASSSLVADYDPVIPSTIYSICSDFTLAYNGPLNKNEHLDILMENCGIQSGVNNAALYSLFDDTYCSEFTSSFKIMNLGSADITSAIIEHRVNGILVETLNWVGLLEPFENEFVYPIAQSSISDLEIELEIVSVNGTLDDDPSDNIKSASFTQGIAVYTPSVIVESFTVGYYNENINWSIYDDTGQNLAWGDNYDYYSTPGSLYADSVVLSPGACYTFFVESYDIFGLMPGSFIRLKDANGALIYEITGEPDYDGYHFHIDPQTYDISIFPFYDIDEDDVYTDGVDFILQNQFFSNVQGLSYYFDGISGIGHFFPDSVGLYEIFYNSDGTWIPIPPVASVNIDSTINNYDLYFELQIGSVHGDVLVDITSGINRCNWQVPYWVTATNESTQYHTGVVEVILPDSVTFISSVPPPDSIIADVFYFSYDSLLPTYSQTYNLIVQMPGVNLIGQDIEVIANTETDSDTLINELICSYDPNDKLVEPAGEGEQAFTAFTDSLLTYTIRFQNTGNDTAFNVIIRDPLSDLLDIGTFKYLSSSHTCQTIINASTRITEFSFENILLPDSNVNQVGSNGYVKFQIEIIDDLEEGAEVENTAGIYFDFNPAIITNTTLNTFATPPFFTSVPDIIDPEFTIYPNPACGIVNIESDFNYSSIEVYSMTGTLLLYKNEDLDSFSVSELVNGNYVVKFSDGISIHMERLIVLH